MASRKKRKKSKKNIQSNLKNEIVSLLIIAIGILIMISLQTESTGEIGKFIRSCLLGLLSTPAYILPYCIIMIGIFSMTGKTEIFDKKFKMAIFFMYIGYVILHTVSYSENIIQGTFRIQNLKIVYDQGIEEIGGGVIGSLLGSVSMRLLGKNGSYVMILTLMIVSFIIITKLSLVTLFKKLRDIVVKSVSLIGHSALEFVQVSEVETKPKLNKKKEMKKVNLKEVVEAAFTKEEDSHKKSKSLNLPKKDVIDEKIKILDFTRDAQAKEKVKEEKPIEKNRGSQKVNGLDNKKDMEDINLHIQKSTIKESTYKFPDLNLLQENPMASNKNDKKEILHKAKVLEETLENFGVDAKVIQVSKGPTITRYEIQPSPGVKVSKIVNLSDDIALNLAASNIRIEAPIPGKAAVGIEIPNESVSMVTIREVLESDKFVGSDSKLTFVLGKDIAGNSITADLGKMPHMLIAGATGSGKSVCINTIIISILYNATPNEVKLLLIDPKVVELNNYNGIPHLLIPVVTDPKKASSALNWAVQEMTNRYKYFAENNVRDISGYNNKMKSQGKETLPKIVVIIDELADLMMVAPGQVEDSICRLAQMARAAGIHLIVATQRPSVDVITGVIKANIPSRISFSVSSQADSRTILDMGGAEKLLGKGDMLFYPVGASKPMRVQGSFISDEEVEKVVSMAKEQSIDHTYEEEIIDKLENNFFQDDTEVDELLQKAIELVVETEQASISMLQRRLRIGYNRAARLIDAMEERGIVGEHIGSKPRNVLLTKEALEQMKSST